MTKLAHIRAYLLDLDGVLTPTAELHRRAWAALFTEEFARLGVLPYREQDYFDHLDGKPRSAGVRDILASRGIELPEGEADDAPETQSVHGLGNRKNAHFNRLLEAEGITPYPGSLRFLDALRKRDLAAAVVTSSRNARRVLTAAGLGDRFDVIVDGKRAAQLVLAGKPAPDTFLQAARELGVAANEAAVVEDALSGVEAGAAGRFGAVIGVNRGAGTTKLASHGASIVVDDLAELIAELPTAQEGA